MVIFFPFVSILPVFLFPSLSPTGFYVFSGALTCRGPLAGMVDRSDVRSMSRPCSPLSVFPSPCIIRPVTSKRPSAHSKGENANARMAVLVMKENDPGYQAPSTRQGQGGQRREKQTAYSPLQSPQLPSLPLHPISLSVTILPLYQI